MSSLSQKNLTESVQRTSVTPICARYSRRGYGRTCANPGANSRGVLHRSYRRYTENARRKDQPVKRAARKAE